MRFSLSLLLTLCVIPVFVFSATNNFNRNLYIGARGEDVLELQRFLNTDIETHVADTGLGSTGNETDYFGQATKRAVVKFQEKYSADVLVPSGLTSGTGFFGEKSREKVNMLLKTSRPESTSKLKKVPTPSVSKGEVIVMFPSQYSGKHGTMISISGAGFTATDNTIYFGDTHAVVKASSWNGQDITFKVPDIPKGIYPLFIKNARGVSNKEQLFVVTDGVTPEPKIDNITPTHASRGSSITIKGSGFVPYGNNIRTGGGFSFEKYASLDGATLSFIVPIDLFTSTTSPSLKKFSIQVWVSVINENGVSNDQSFVLDL